MCFSQIFFQIVALDKHLTEFAEANVLCTIWEEPNVETASKVVNMQLTLFFKESSSLNSNPIFDVRYAQTAILFGFYDNVTHERQSV